MPLTLSLVTFPPLEKNFSLFNEFSNHTKNPSPPPSHHDILSKFPFLPILKKKKKNPLTLKAKSVSSDYLFESVNPPHSPNPQTSLFFTQNFSVYLPQLTSAQLTSAHLTSAHLTSDQPNSQIQIHTPRSQYNFTTMLPPKYLRRDWAIINPDTPCQGCNHRFGLLKSNTILIYWNCQLCHSGPHMFIYQCFLCRRKVCRPCSIKT